MICHIVQNGGYMCLILCCIIVANSAILEQTLTVQAFCSGNLYMHNIEPGEPYILNLKSDRSSAGINKLYHKLYKRKCRQEFKTSDAAAHFEVSITNMNIPSCSNCRCNYFEISVFGHSKRFCGSSEDFFSSKSDKLVIDFYPGPAMLFDVTFTFSVKRNLYLITGTPTEAYVPINFIETPYFPLSYPPNYRAEYIIQSGNTEFHVMLLFLDFRISHQSFIEVAGNDDTNSTRFYGDLFRPPVIVSQSDQLTLKFESDDQRDMPGFRAEVWVIKSIDPLFVPYTDCGGPKVERDGNIHIKPHEGFRLYDCLWHIMPVLISAELNLSVIVQLRDIGHKSNLEFRQGRYSKSEIVKRIDCEVQNCSILDAETVVPVSDFFIRFSGYLEEYSVVNMSYHTYRMGNCSNKEFRCSDGRCLLLDFQCDGIKQCPDGLDEASCPSLEVLEREVSLHPSVQTESYHSDTIHVKFFYVVLLGVAGLITVVVAVFIFFYKHCQQTSVAGQILPDQAVIGELSAVQPALYTENSYDCDRPPSYEDFIKSSDNYPPLLYTRTNQRFIPNASCAQCTTSFCTGPRVQHYSADSFSIRSSDTGSDIFLNITGDNSHLAQPPCFNKYNVEINQNLRFKTRKTIKRTYSLDSKLNDLVNTNSCNFFLSIIHSVCSHLSNSLPHVQYDTLPSNFKINAFKTSSCNRPQVNRPADLHCDCTVNFPKDRQFTWSFVPNASVTSEIVTIVKTRCFSDPCNGISVHCSLY